jgi:hypothetical protein
MNPSRIHAALDGELPSFLLTDREQAELKRLERASAAAAEALRSTPVPTFAASVLAALPAEAPRPAFRVAVTQRIAGAARWLWSPRPVAVRPAWAFAAAAALLLAAPHAPELAGGRAETAAESPAASVYVQFRLDAPGARQVALAGSFTGWEPRHELREAAPGVWTLVVPLEAGIHDYLFVVDGERWTPDPAAYPSDDGFGGTNSRIFLQPASAT